MSPPAKTVGIVLLWALSGSEFARASGGDPVLFSDQTQPAGLAHTHSSTLVGGGERKFMTPGAAAADLDRDGWQDLVVHGGMGQNAMLFMNDGDGTFTELALAWSIDLTSVEGASVTVGDVNRDGWPDLYLGTILGRNYLFINTGAGAFVENAVAAGVAMLTQPNQPWPNSTFGATFGDIDLDGDLDLYVAEWSPLPIWGNRLFLNDGEGIFTDITVAADLDITSGYWAFSPTLVDLNGDRFPDLPVAADFLTSRYFVNMGGASFDELPENGTCTDENGMGSTLGDYDNDGDLDWFVTSIFDDDGDAEGNWGLSGNRLYRNDGLHQFTDVTDEAGVRDGGWGWGTSFADLDHDGWLDLVMTNGFGAFGNNPDSTFETDPTRVWLSSGGGGPGGPTFQDVAAAVGLVHTDSGKALVTFDADNDGDLDIAITSNYGPFAFYRNDSDPGPGTWLELDLAAPPGNAPQGIGATVTVTTSGMTLTRAVTGGTTYMAQNPQRVHVGFPTTEMIDDVTVRWPDGTVSRRLGVAPGQILTIVRCDLNGDLAVDVQDLVALLFSWGPCAGCAADFDDDGAVAVGDLIMVLLSWQPAG